MQAFTSCLVQVDELFDKLGWWNEIVEDLDVRIRSS
jgi:hypothetical protein